MTENSNVERHPVWEHVADQIAADPPEPGHIFPREELAKRLHIKLPTPETPHGEAKKLELAALQHFTALREALGEDHGILIEARGMQGYEVVAPGKHVPTVINRRTHNIKRELRNLRREAMWAPFDQLTQEQRREAMNELARVGQLATQMQRRKKALDKWLLSSRSEA